MLESAQPIGFAKPNNGKFTSTSYATLHTCVFLVHKKLRLLIEKMEDVGLKFPLELLDVRGKVEQLRKGTGKGCLKVQSGHGIHQGLEVISV